MNRIFKTALIMGLMAMAGRVYGDTATLVPAADTSLFENEPDNNLGASLSLVSGANTSGFRSRELMRFNFTGQIPSNAVIQSVALSVNVVTVPGGGGGAASVFDMRRLLVDWTEGIGTGNMGSAANTGETTWNHRFYPATSWIVPGGGISNDFSSTVSASLLWSGVGTYTFTSTSNLVADVQQWVANPATNFGWIFISESENVAQTARRIGSREDTNNTPSLLVQYVVPVVPVIQNIQLAGGVIQFSFSARAGETYSVLYRNSLTNGAWLTLTNISQQAVTTNLTISDSLSNNVQRYYRIAAQY
jgi:hypothetical protein